jgi:glycosyltransferase involved in cell wall biosynthesis
MEFVRKSWNIWRPNEEPPPNGETIFWPISICTVCAGRTRDLCRTLLRNVSDNEDYPLLEFVVLNYNSNDDLDAFMETEQVATHIRNGRVRYLRTRTPRYYSTSHSRNVAFKHASGQLVANVDADNYTGLGFASYLNLLANLRSHHVIFVPGKRRIHGRLAMFKSEFEALGGYDEELVGYGWEDYSLLGRAMKAGYTLMWWRGRGRHFGERILTAKSDVAVNMENSNWTETELKNKMLSLEKIHRNELVANRNARWGWVPDLEAVTT